MLKYNPKGLFLLTAFLFVTIFTYCKNEVKYKFDDISDELKAKAKVIYRNNSQKFELISPPKAVLTINNAVTILNNNGIKSSVLVIPYDKFSKVRKIKAVLYNKDGEKIRRMFLSDVVH